MALSTGVCAVALAAMARRASAVRAERVVGAAPRDHPSPSSRPSALMPKRASFEGFPSATDIETTVIRNGEALSIDLPPAAAAVLGEVKLSLGDVIGHQWCRHRRRSQRSFATRCQTMSYGARKTTYSRACPKVPSRP